MERGRSIVAARLVNGSPVAMFGEVGCLANDRFCECGE